MSDDGPVSADYMRADYTEADYTQLDDSTLIAMRRQVREQMERQPADLADLMRTHHLLTTEVVRRTIALRGQQSKQES